MTAGVRGRTPYKNTYNFARNETKTITFPYDAGVGRMSDFDISLRINGRDKVETSFPLDVPPAVEIVLDQTFYFPEEENATVEIYNRLHPTPERGQILLEVNDLITGNSVVKMAKEIASPTMAFSFPIGDLRINELPVQDYRVTAFYYDDNYRCLDLCSAYFGRINHTQRRPLPPIKKLRVDDTGRLIINDDFRFFPIIPSVNLMDWHDAIDLGANIFRGYYRPREKDGKKNEINTLDETDRVWDIGAYSITIGPFPDGMEDFEREAGEVLSHPGFLSCYPKQFYYWNLPKELDDYRKEVERIFGEQPNPRLVIWGHHDSSFLYDLDNPKWPIENPPVGYCYVKIMGRPGSAWRNAPFLTQTEQILDPHKFKLAEVNCYVSWHDDEIVPEHFSTYLSIRGDDLKGFRNESYLSIIYGADGLYHYLCVQKGDLQIFRGWFQELNYMWPIFVADDAENAVTISPLDSMVETRLKKWNGKYYLLTANASEKASRVNITIDGFDGMTVRKLFDLPGDMNVQKNAITDTWRKHDTYVYEITLPGQ